MRHGFSLVELSIVLVILGLLTGGILAGQNLIRAAELRSAVTDVNRYRAAVYTFRDKYFSLPGDMPNAQSFWTACVDGTGGYSSYTCNGDGNGQLSGPEVSRPFEHMAHAGLIEGSYDGSGAVSIVDAFARVLGEPMRLIYYSNVGRKDNTSVLLNENVFLFDDQNNPFSETEMWQVDTKVDDGRPQTGGFMVSADGGSSAGCLTVAGDEYDFTESGNYDDCHLLWK